MERLYTKMNQEQIEKIGNSIVFFAQNIPYLTKTKVLKLLYILDEISIKNSGIPFFNLTYKVWKYGPVSEEIFIDLSLDKPDILSEYIQTQSQDNITYVQTESVFCDDEFSNVDIALLEYVTNNHGKLNAGELVEYTHRKDSPWFNLVDRHGLSSGFDNGSVTNTEIVIDLTELISHDQMKKNLYKEFQLFN